ncbi:Hint domain-containing protein [Pseudooceanicola sp. LIPI14-2-Ac024]|uniref:Hint domain-containing protein n=1 Tax=Pseudooceanicola sp. LIPI14-2-Ac024 TaxID=3344875 RepID=UPI0035D10C0F
MTMTPRALAQELADKTTQAPKRRGPLLRRYSVSRLDEAGREKITEHMAPATAEFENAFNAFARGAVVQTTEGPCAVEDLRPGMFLETAEHGAQEVLWIGSMTVVPTAPVPDPAQVRMTRIRPDRFGYACPSADLMVGPGARVLHTPDVLRDHEERGQTYVGLADFVDYDTVFEVTPGGPVDTFHICLARHSTILAQGLGVESFHPGHRLAEQMGPHKMALFLSLFPHVTELRDFGPLAHPRLDRETIARLNAA